MNNVQWTERNLLYLFMVQVMGMWFNTVSRPEGSHSLYVDFCVYLWWQFIIFWTTTGVQLLTEFQSLVVSSEPVETRKKTEYKWKQQSASPGKKWRVYLKKGELWAWKAWEGGKHRIILVLDLWMFVFLGAGTNRVSHWGYIADIFMHPIWGKGKWHAWHENDMMPATAKQPNQTCASSWLTVIKSRDKLKLRARTPNLLMEHQWAHTKHLTVTSVGEEEAKGGVNRSWWPQPAPWTPHTATMTHNKASSSSAPQKKTLHPFKVIKSFQSAASQLRFRLTERVWWTLQLQCTNILYIQR